MVFYFNVKGLQAVLNLKLVKGKLNTTDRQLNVSFSQMDLIYWTVRCSLKEKRLLVSKVWLKFTLLSKFPPIWVSLQFLSMMYWMVELSIMKAYFPSDSMTFSMPSLLDETITSALCMPEKWIFITSLFRVVFSTYCVVRYCCRLKIIPSLSLWRHYGRSFALAFYN